MIASANQAGACAQPRMVHERRGNRGRVRAQVQPGMDGHDRGLEIRSLVRSEFSSRRRTGAGAKRAIGCGPAGAVRPSRARPDAPKLCRNVEDQREKGRVDLARQPEARSGDQLVAHERDPGRGHGRV